MDPLLRGDRATLSVTTREVEQAESVRAFFGTTQPTLSIQAGDSSEAQLTVPPELTAVILQLIDLVGQGRTVTIGALPREVTTTVAAQMLNVSRPTVMKLVREQKIPAHKVGAHTRLLSRDVIEYRRAQLDRQRAAFDELRALEEQLGITD
ncbi:helix-turn-helix domain-containing protein [Nocardia higoensis]|uniref:helix-turn-helix domain-containing protein n=1 Tax=Nocardia higoensis TaxID=228599 RepID=UPI00031D754C|nr:helix-turn-helix domain-containing protein [Nocardia higoensis]